MKFLDRGENTPEKSESRIEQLTAALEEAERKIAERELWVAEAVDQTEAARSQYEQANARAETLRRHLTAKEEQLITLQAELHQRDERIAALERSHAKNAANHEAKQTHRVNLVERLSELGLALESVDQPGTFYRINRTITTLGRNAANDISIDSNSVSRFHARIVVEADGVFLIDLESTNGCKVNGKRVTRQMIGNADAITVGSVKFRFSVGVPAEVEARGMQETHVLLNDSVILIPAPKEKPKTAQ